MGWDGEHQLVIDERNASGEWVERRWRCSCGSHGQWRAGRKAREPENLRQVWLTYHVRPGCWHCQGENTPSPRTINGHTYTLDWRSHPTGRWEEWRWLCSCGLRRRGRWTAQSDSVCYHAWLKHVGKRQAGS